MPDLMSLSEAAAYIGKSPLTLRRLYYEGLINAVGSSGGHKLIFEVADLDKLKLSQYPEGMSHAEIGDRYGVSRTRVIYHYNRLRVKPLATERSYGRKVYDEATVIRFAKILGWVEVVHPPETQTDAAQSPAP